ncbi:hypothetical protein Tco_1237086 [Tanacetum coccineum]
MYDPLYLEVWSITFPVGLQIQHAEDLTSLSPFPTAVLTTAFGPAVVTLLTLVVLIFSSRLLVLAADFWLNVLLTGLAVLMDVAALGELCLAVLTGNCPDFVTTAVGTKFLLGSPLWIYEWNKNVPWVYDKPWLDNGIWKEPKPFEHTCKPFNYKIGCSKWPTCGWREDGYFNGGNFPGAYHIRNSLHYQDLEWYEALEDSELKDEALRNKAIMEGLNSDDESSNDMDSIISLGQKNTLAECMILSSADNRFPPMLDKDLYDSWKSRMELYMQNREHRRMILESVEHGPLIWPTVEENKVIRTKKYAELSAAEKIQYDCDMKATNIIL